MVAVPRNVNSPPAARPTKPSKGTSGVTIGRGELMIRTQPARMPQTLPVVLSVQESLRLIDATRNLKHQTSLSRPTARRVPARHRDQVEASPSGNSRNTTG